MSAALPVVLVPVGTDDEALMPVWAHWMPPRPPARGCGWLTTRRPARVAAR